MIWERILKKWGYNHLNEVRRIKQYQIWWMDLGQQESSSHIQAGQRPVLILQNNVGNIFSPVVEICPISSQVDKAKMPTHIILDTDSGLTKKSFAMIEQKQTVNKYELIECIGEAPKYLHKDIQRAYWIQGGVEPNKFETDKFVTKFADKYNITNNRLLLAMCKELESYMKTEEIEHEPSELIYNLHTVIAQSQTQKQPVRQHTYV